ncbi:MAG: hypothetical protein ABIK09_05980 [Pseudomonadota bacterium]
MKFLISGICIGILAIGFAACDNGGNSNGGGTPEPDQKQAEDTNTAPDVATTGPMVIQLDCSDAIDALYGDPGILPDEKGAIIFCAADGTLTAADIDTELAAAGYDGPAATSGATMYRILYATQRGNGDLGASAALVFLPDTPPADIMPMVVASHGSRGQAAKCAPSTGDPAGDYVRDDFINQVYPMVGYGFPVIAPDLAGYANFGAEGNPPSAYAHALDVARSTLDGARALRTLIPARLDDQIVLTGHSQGGHTALAAAAEAVTYGAGGDVAAVATYAPLWLPARSWGALFLLADAYPIAEVASVNAVTIWYHYTHAELYDGPGAGRLLFAAEHQDTIQDFVEGSCWSSSYPTLEAAATVVTELFDPAFVSAVMIPAATGQPCSKDEPAKTVCETWLERYAADRPHFTGALAEVPQLVVYGGLDTTIPPDRIMCALDRLETDGVNSTQCFDPLGTHGSIVANQSDYVVQWIASKTLGTELSETCPSDEILLLDGDGDPIACNNIPPND